MDNENTDSTWNYEARMAAKEIRNAEIAKERRINGLIMIGLGSIGTLTACLFIISRSL